MPGSNQIPAGAEGAAALSFTYSGISLICSAVLLWLTIIHREMWSYVSLLAISTGLSTIASLTQQVHDTLFYEDIMREQFRRKTHFFNSPELAIANGSFGLDLGLYYFQYYSYNVQALLVMFWAGELAQSVYGLSNKPKARRILGQVNTAGKAISFLFPAITILTLRAPSLQRNFFAFILLADLPLMISLAVGSFTMMMISWRYVKTKKSFTNWTPPGGSQQSKSQTSSSVAQTEFSSTQYGGSAASGGRKAPRKPGFHDRWLMVRFTVSFIILAVFEVTNILFQLQAIKNLENDSKLDSADLSVGRANTTYFLFLPGVTAGIFLFIVFGTTKGCREKVRETFVPPFVERWLSKRRQRRGEKDEEGGGLEFTYPETTDAFPDETGNNSPGKGRIMRSSSITVTYHNNKNGPRRHSRIMDPNEISSDSDDYRTGDNVAMSDLQPMKSSQNAHAHAHASSSSRPHHHRSPSDQTLDSVPDSASTDEIITISHAAPVTPATHIAHNLERSNSISNTVTSANTSITAGRVSIEQLMKPLPIPTDTPMSRIAYFQSMNRSPPPQAGGTRDRQTVTVNEMDRHFAEHERRQVQQRQHQRTQSQQQQQQQQQQVQLPPRAAQPAAGLTRQWSQGSINSSRVGFQQPQAPPRPASAAQHRSRPGSTSQRGQMGELYYGSSPEHSDDSGPVLPVMGGARR